jgi:hypothetical protein
VFGTVGIKAARSALKLAVHACMSASGQTLDHAFD